jgi:hypothetical protein
VIVWRDSAGNVIDVIHRGEQAMQRLDFELNGGVVTETVKNARDEDVIVKRQNVVRGRVIIGERDIVIEVESTDPVNPARVVGSFVDNAFVVAGEPVPTVDPADKAEVDRLAREALLQAPRETRSPTPFVSVPAASPVFGAPTVPANETEDERRVRLAREANETPAERQARERNEREIAAAGPPFSKGPETDEERRVREAHEREVAATHRAGLTDSERESVEAREAAEAAERADEKADDAAEERAEDREHARATTAAAAAAKRKR